MKISTTETENAYQITITDDGVGFNSDKSKDDGRTHIGLSNVRARVEMQTGGAVHLDTSINKGTTVTIIIPKDGMAK